MIKTKSIGFSIEVKSKEHIKTVSLSNGHFEEVLIEGDLGRLHEITMFEDKVLVIKGQNGTMRVGLSKEELLSSLMKEGEEK